MNNFREEDHDASNRTCTSPTLEFKTFYAIQCDANGGLLEVDVSANTSGGNIQAALYGPVTGTCPNYNGAGASYVDCEDGTNPAPLSTNAGPNAIYILEISSEKAGSFTASSTANSTALPIDLIDFKGELIDKIVYLNWKTLSEYNNKGFEIQRSRDLTQFEKLAFVQGKGNSNEVNEYEYIDVPPSSGIYYYRLAQLDYDGKSSLSNSIQIEINADKSYFKMYPNPANDQLYFESGSELKKIKILNAFGKAVEELTFEHNTRQTQLSLINLSSGVYQLLIETDHGFINKQLITIH
jgi:hypothetical protein